MMVRSALRPIGRVLAGAALILAVLASPAAAHDPIFLTADQTTPDTGPYMPDGSISWALYGSVLEEGDTRGFEFDLRDGDDLVLSLLIPNLSPELELTDDQLPYVELEAPDGTSRTITANVRTEFDEPFSRTSYVSLYEETSPGQAGRYRGVVVGNAPARFSLAIGITEIFFTETERSGDRPTNFAEIDAPLQAWYSTPPGGVADTSAVADGEGAIDLEMIEEAMESGEAQAPADSIAVDDAAAGDELADDELGEGVMGEGDDIVADDGEPAADAATSAVDGAAEPATDAVGDLADEGASLGWVAPVGIGVVVLGALGFAFTRRRGTE